MGSRKSVSRAQIKVAVKGTAESERREHRVMKTAGKEAAEGRGQDGGNGRGGGTEGDITVRSIVMRAIENTREQHVPKSCNIERFDCSRE